MALKKFFTPKARLAFANITRPKKNERNEDRYGAALVFRPAEFTKEDKSLWDALVAEVKAELGKFGPGRPARSPFKKGENAVDRTGKPYDGFGPGVVFFDTTTKHGPDDPDYPMTLVDVNGEPLDADAFYSGAYARAQVNVFSYESKGNRGVSFGLLGLQWLGDGERFGGGAAGFRDAPPVRGEVPVRRSVRPSSEEAQAGRPDDRAPSEGYGGPMDGDEAPF